MRRPLLVGAQVLKAEGNVLLRDVGPRVVEQRLQLEERCARLDGEGGLGVAEEVAGEAAELGLGGR